MEGNQMKMRDALTDICRGLETKIKDSPASVTAHEMAIYKRCKAALATPPRNCDVGTAEEQEDRYKATGEVYHTLTLTNALAWAQMPYLQEGGAQ